MRFTKDIPSAEAEICLRLSVSGEYVLDLIGCESFSQAEEALEQIMKYQKIVDVVKIKRDFARKAINTQLEHVLNEVLLAK